MARKVFFSFHFKRDAWRAGQVRNSNLLSDEDKYGVIDSVEWEKVEKQGEAAIAKWINEQLTFTSVTAVLIGAETSERDWVDYEIRQSWEKGNGLVGIKIHGLKDQQQQTDLPGANPLDQITLVDNTKLSSIFKTYDWNLDNGREYLGKWVEEAYQLRQAYRGEKILQVSRTKVTTPSSSNISQTPIGFTPHAPWTSQFRTR